MECNPDLSFHHVEACVLDSKFSTVVFTETPARIYKGKAPTPVAAAGEEGWVIGGWLGVARGWASDREIRPSWGGGSCRQARPGPSTQGPCSRRRPQASAGENVQCASAPRTTGDALRKAGLPDHKADSSRAATWAEPPSCYPGQLQPAGAGRKGWSPHPPASRRLRLRLWLSAGVGGGLLHFTGSLLCAHQCSIDLFLPLKCSIFNTLKVRPSTSREIMTCLIATPPWLCWSGTEPSVPEDRLSSQGGGPALHRQACLKAPGPGLKDTSSAGLGTSGQWAPSRTKPRTQQPWRQTPQMASRPGAPTAPLGRPHLLQAVLGPDQAKGVAPAPPGAAEPVLTQLELLSRSPQHQRALPVKPSPLPHNTNPIMFRVQESFIKGAPSLLMNDVPTKRSM